LSAHVLENKVHELGDVARRPMKNQVSTITADSSDLYDALAPRRNGHTVMLALAVSVVVHAAAITFLPGMRTPQPRIDVITVELEHKPPPETPKKIAPPRPLPKPRPIEKPFERQEVQAIPTPTVVPQPQQIDPRKDVALEPRPEPRIERGLQPPEPVTVARTEPRLLPEAQPVPQQPRIERERIVTEPPRPEPVGERRADVRPEPRLEPRVEPRLQAIDPHPTAKPEQRVEPVATPRAEPVLQPQRQQVTAAPVSPRLDDAPVIKSDVPPTVARLERQSEVKAVPRVEPVLAAPPRPVAEPARPEQTAPRVEPLAERKPQPVVAPRREIRPDAPAVEMPRAQPQPQEAVRNDIVAAVPTIQAAPQQIVERNAPQLAAPAGRPPEIRQPVKPEPVIEARAPQLAAPKERPPEVRQPVKQEPIIEARAQPPAPKRNVAEERAAIERFAREISKQFDVSERDYPRLARDRRWQGTTQLLLNIKSDGKLGEVSVATSSGYDILDRRALELLNKVKLPALPPEIQSRAFAVRVPVRFALRD
jgi:protein TonB